MVEFETFDIGLFVRMSSDYVIPIFSDYVIPIFRWQEVTYLQTRYIDDDDVQLNSLVQLRLQVAKFIFQFLRFLSFPSSYAPVAFQVSIKSFMEYWKRGKNRRDKHARACLPSE